MRNKQGFTLVELLVVMAIIAILAAIVVPNASRFIGRARATRALAEIQGMETAMTAMVTDAGRSSLGQMFKKGEVPILVAGADQTNPPGVSPEKWTLAAAGNLEAAVEIYSSVVYDLLRYGRDVLRSDTASDYARLVIDRNVLAKLGTSYMDVGNDSWGSAYRIFPGPWNIVTPGNKGTFAPIYFRKFSVDAGDSKRKAKNDAYSLRGGQLPDGSATPDRVSIDLASIVGDDSQTWPDKVGFPADSNKSVYIWSIGENMRNSQMVYTAAFDPTNAVTWYPGAQDGSDLGGGDDVNNWDKDSTWTRFTN